MAVFLSSVFNPLVFNAGVNNIIPPVDSDCLLALEDGTGFLVIEDQTGYLKLEFCANDNTPGGGKVKYTAPIRRPNPDANSYERSKYEWEQKERDRLAREQAENAHLLAEKEAEIAKLEKARQTDLANEAMQVELLQLMQQLAGLQEQQRLIAEIIAFWQREQDDELALLYCLPFVL